ncbi:MAG: DUF1929 domain-containing protein [Armatimonadetes bacterium]|nr:DUF1929 domain-containing protein [Armatimonadota bacterium]
MKLFLAFCMVLGFAFAQQPSLALNRYEGSTVLLPRMEARALNPQNLADQVMGQVAQIGGADGCTVHGGASFITLLRVGGNAEVTWERGPASPNGEGKVYLNATILPTGQILINGGMKKPNDCDWTWEDVSYSTWLYRAGENGQWGFGAGALIPLADAPRGDTDKAIQDCFGSNARLGGQHGTPDAMRAYGSTTVLLADSSLLSAGTNMVRHRHGPEVECDKYVSRSPTLFFPPYAYRPGTNEKRTADERPRILSIPREETWAYGEVAKIKYAKAKGDYAAEIKSVALVRPSSVSRSVNSDQMLVRCHFRVDGDTVEAAMPWDPKIAPPGWYMLFLVDANDAPSEAGWVRIDTYMGATIEGVFEDYKGFDSPVRVEIRELDADTYLGEHALPVSRINEGGRFQIRALASIRHGKYRVHIKPFGDWQGKTVETELTGDRRLDVGTIKKRP